MACGGLLVQVVGAATRWYASDLLPRPQALNDPSLDPLGEICRSATRPDSRSTPG
jgi:hypothetical protein